MTSVRSPNRSPDWNPDLTRPDLTRPDPFYLLTSARQILASLPQLQTARANDCEGAMKSKCVSVGAVAPLRTPAHDPRRNPESETEEN